MPKKYHVGYTCGVFDVFHVGHLNLLERCKEKCDILIVGVCDDTYVREIKKKEPVYSETDRVRILKALKVVDDAVLVDIETTNDKELALDKFRFDVLFSGDDWKEIGIDTAKGAGKGAIRGAAVYTATNVFHMPASLASAAVSGAFIIAEKTMEYRRGNCDKKGYAFGVIDGCANVAVSALSAEIGKRIIPNPMIGSIVGSLIGGGLYQLTKTIVLRSSSYPSDKERKEQAA